MHYNEGAAFQRRVPHDCGVYLDVCAGLVELKAIKMTIITGLEILGSFLGIVAFIITIKERINRAIGILTLPKQVDFYFLSFYALVSAAAGGLVWNSICSLSGPECSFVGGTGSEPHGTLAFIWPVATLSIVIMTLWTLNWKYRFIKVQDQLLQYLAFLIGVTIASVLFYDLSLFGNSGFRNYFDAINMPFVEKEFALVLIWSLLIALLGFLAMGLVRIQRAYEVVGIRAIVLPLLEQVGLCVGLTTFAVAFCVLVFPQESRFETARGIIAGLALRMSLFFGLLIAHVPLSGAPIAGPPHAA